MQTPLSQRVQSIPPSGLRKYFDIAATMTDVVSLTIGEPDFVTPDTMRRAAIQSIERGETKYTSNSGTVELRDALARHLNARYHVQYDPDAELLVTVGVSEALHCGMLATIDPGDEVIVPEPAFVAYKPSVVFAGGKAVVVETRVEDNFQVTGEEIERAITPRTKGVLIGYPNNPTGAVMTRENLLQVARIAEKHNLLVFSDEIYDRLVYGIEHVCFSALPGMRDRTILLGGFSKDYAMTGWRVGYVAAPREFARRMIEPRHTLSINASTPSQWAALAALTGPQEPVEAMIRAYAERRAFMMEALDRLDLSYGHPGGAFYVYTNVSRSGLAAPRFCERLLEEARVLVFPGRLFGDVEDKHIRISLLQPIERMREAVTRIEAARATLLRG